MIRKRYKPDTIGDYLKRCPELIKTITPTPSLECEIIISCSINKTKEFIASNPNYTLSRKQGQTINRYMKLRKKRLPLAYILGWKEFYNNRFMVNKSVLIPRPETEGMIDLFNKIAPNNPNRHLNVLDIGTGTGCIAISVFDVRGNISVTAIDINKSALKCARLNAGIILPGKLRGKINFKQMDILNRIPIEKYDIILSNPPYIKSDLILKLEPEIRLQEPPEALDGGVDGLKYYNRFNLIFPQLLKKEGFALLEIDPKASRTLKQLYSKQFKIKFYKDYSGQYRYIYLSLPNGNG